MAVVASQEHDTTTGPDGGDGIERTAASQPPSVTSEVPDSHPGMAPPPEDHPKQPAVASVFSAPDHEIPESVVKAVYELEKTLRMPVFLIIQNSDDRNYAIIDERLADAVRRSTHELKQGPIAIVVDSGGGLARSAYRIAKTLRRHYGTFTAVVPNRAKSAATLLCLGAQRILLARDAELGPIDVRIYEPGLEKWTSALDETQVLERLHAATLDFADSSMFLLKHRTKKTIAELLPIALRFASDTMRPLYNKIDAVRYSWMSRELRVGEEYARRLLGFRYSAEEASKIAGKLVVDYPEHSFVIDLEEAGGIGLNTERLSDDIEHVVEVLLEYGRERTLVGFLRRASGNVDGNGDGQ